MTKPKLPLQVSSQRKCSQAGIPHKVWMMPNSICCDGGSLEVVQCANCPGHVKLTPPRDCIVK